MIPKLRTPGMIYHVSLGPAMKFHFHSTRSLELPIHTILSPRSPFQGSLKQLQRYNSYNWLAGSPLWVSEVLDKHIHIQGGYQWRWTHDSNTSKLGPIFMVRFLSVDQDSNLRHAKDARCLITWHQHLLGKNCTTSIGPRLHSTILASGTWNFKVSNNNFNCGIRFDFLRCSSISGISSANHRLHLYLRLSDTSYRQSEIIIWESLSVLQTAKAQKHSWILPDAKFFCCVGALLPSVRVPVDSNNA